MLDRSADLFPLLDADQLYELMRSSIGAVGGAAAVLSAQVAERIRGIISAEDRPVDRLAITHRLKGTIAGYRSATLVSRDGTTSPTPPYMVERVLGRVLYALIRLGDVAAVDGRRFLPTPTRLVNVRGSDVALIISSDSCAELEAFLGARVTSTGVARVVRRGELAPARRPDEALWQSFGEWLGNKEHRLDDWSRMKLLEISKQLRLGMLSDAENVAILAAIEGRSAWQRLEAIRNPPRGFALARFNYVGTKRTEYCICTIHKQNNVAEIERSAPVAAGEGDRLAFGLARLSGNPIRITMAVEDDQIHVDVPVRLPSPENKVLLLAEWTHQRLRGEARTFHRRLLELVRDAYRICGAEVTVTGSGA